MARKKSSRKKKTKYVSFQRRLWANVIDITILTAIAFISYKVMFSSGNINTDLTFSAQLFDSVSTNSTLNLFLLLAISILCLTYYSLYYLILWVAGQGQTLGFRMMGIKLVRDDGKRISYPLAYLRFISSVFSFTFFFMGFFYILYNKKAKTWHDYICHTSVIED